VNSRKARAIRVLVIDAYDERDMYAEALGLYGFAVDTAATAAEGLKLLERQHVDVIVHGLVFPDLSGIELARQLRTRRETKRTPLIVLSGFIDQHNLDAVRATGCSSILVKPCDPGMLAAEIRRVLADTPPV
jgi:two-component system phosphate regulon response regulator PhoB